MIVSAIVLTQEADITDTLDKASVSQLSAGPSLKIDGE